jgi:DNA-binding response OmpR family regulator
MGTLEENVTRIVLIEDDDLMREWLGRSISSRGFEVARYRRADEALDSVSANPPDAIVSDVHMPGMSGVAFGHALRERGLDVPLVLMTADPNDELESQASDCGARQLLRKPFADVAELWSAVDDALANAPSPDITQASHALRTPLTAIRMAFEGLVAGRTMDAHEQHLAEIAVRNLDRLTTALEDHLARLALASDRRSPVD